MTPIETKSYKVTPPKDLGAAPMLSWVNIADLVVDRSYQRDIREQGRRNVERIANNFRWSCFAPVVVSPLEGGGYAIIDGQHRTTAAALAGVERVPCVIVVADRSEQALAFKAINSNVTKMSRMAIHAAAVVAGDGAASVLQQACAIAEVELLRYPVARHLQKPGQTMSIQAAAACLAQYGRDTFITAMQCVTMTDRNQKPGVLTSSVIRALCSVMDTRREWRDAGERLFEAFEEIDVEELDYAAAVRAVQARGATRATVLAEILTAELQERMRVPEAVD